MPEKVKSSMVAVDEFLQFSCGFAMQKSRTGSGSEQKDEVMKKIRTRRIDILLFFMVSKI